MNDRILVTYASQGGATAGIAKEIGQTFSAQGMTADVLPVEEVTGLNGYRAVVLGSAVHSGKWMPEIMDFVQRNQNSLQRVPTAAFQVCMMLAARNEQYKSMVPGWFAPLHAWIRPAAEASFAGALWPDRYPKLTDKLGLHIFLAAIHLKAGDYRDLAAVRAWAETIRPLLCR